MTKKVRTVKPGDSVQKAVSVMNRYGIGSVLVCDKEIKGIITERDVLKRVVALRRDPRTPCKSVMTNRIVTIDADEKIEDAIEIMTKKNIKKLPVTSGGELVGIVTATDIMKSGERIEEAALKKLAQFFAIYMPRPEAG